MVRPRFDLRVAQPADAEAVTAVLASAYGGLMQADYAPKVLALVLTAMTTANPALLASGTYYVQATREGRIVACGGWTHTAPGTGTMEAGIAHIRHFGTHVDWTRHGLGAGIFDRCRRGALAAGVHTFWCFSSLGAEPFYASLGFASVERRDITIGGQMGFPTIAMIWADRPTTAG